MVWIVEGTDGSAGRVSLPERLQVVWAGQTELARLRSRELAPCLWQTWLPSMPTPSALSLPLLRCDLLLVHVSQPLGEKAACRAWGIERVGLSGAGVGSGWL